MTYQLPSVRSNEICRKMTADFAGTAVTIEIDAADAGRHVLPLEVS